jgi:ribosomal protein S18 acetylase RimI-like enzyme
MAEFATEHINTIVTNRSGIEPVQFALYRGMSSESVDQLIEYSQTDPEVVAQTSDPKRFSSEAAIEAWLKKGGGRFPYTLTNPENILSGLIWFGPDPMPTMETISQEVDPTKYGFTFAIRTYKEARGKGLAVPFMRLSFEDMQRTPAYSNNDVQNFWLETSQSNAPAVKAYENFGFKHATTQPDHHGRILMVYQTS